LGGKATLRRRNPVDGVAPRADRGTTALRCLQPTRRRHQTRQPKKPAIHLGGCRSIAAEAPLRCNRTASALLKRIQEGYEVCLLLSSHSNVEALIIKLDDLIQRGCGPVMKIGRASCQSA
jgi:hypothetical protein